MYRVYIYIDYKGYIYIDYKGVGVSQGAWHDKIMVICPRAVFVVQIVIRNNTNHSTVLA